MGNGKRRIRQFSYFYNFFQFNRRRRSPTEEEEEEEEEEGTLNKRLVITRPKSTLEGSRSCVSFTMNIKSLIVMLTIVAT